jgi:EamA domain-containing membrane protein RarD
MITKKLWFKVTYKNYTKCSTTFCIGYFLFGFLPIYIKEIKKIDHKNELTIEQDTKWMNQN